MPDRVEGEELSRYRELFHAVQLAQSQLARAQLDVQDFHNDLVLMHGRPQSDRLDPGTGEWSAQQPPARSVVQRIPGARPAPAPKPAEPPADHQAETAPSQG